MRAARVNLIVAINKIDKPNADVDRTKKALFDAGWIFIVLKHLLENKEIIPNLGVNLEDFGGDVQSVPISALKGTNVDLLIEAILAQVKPSITKIFFYK